MEMLKWIWRGLVSRLAMITRLIPAPPHRRDPEVSEHFMVEPPEVHLPPPTSHLAPPPGHSDEPEMRPQQHVNPAPELEHGHPKL